LKRSLPLLAVLLVATACSASDWPDRLRRVPGPDDVVALVPWFSTMHYGIAIQPYKMPVPRPPVEGTIPVTGSEPPLPITNPANLPAINAQKNPVPRTAASLDIGKKRFDVYCLPCHGEKAAGDGPVNAKLMVAPSLLTDRAKKYTDGYIYSIIRHGGAIMPAYGDRIPPTERWDVVNYLRVLQGIGQ
jgi:mono/diheme cytochrome c family protein